MDALLATLQRWDLHPVVDHFTVSLLIVGVLIDLVASLASTRMWLRYMALTLMILGAIAAGSSYFTGDMEADRVWKIMSPGAKSVLHWHAMLGEYFAIVFAVLAVWRILIEVSGIFAGSRPIYLIAAVISAGVLMYIGYLGGEMVYTYGVGTAPEALSAVPTATPTMIENQALPTVTVPTMALPIPTATATPMVMMITPAPIVTPLPTP